MDILLYVEVADIADEINLKKYKNVSIITVSLFINSPPWLLALKNLIFGGFVQERVQSSEST